MSLFTDVHDFINLLPAFGSRYLFTYGCRRIPAQEIRVQTNPKTSLSHDFWRLPGNVLPAIFAYYTD